MNKTVNDLSVKFNAIFPNWISMLSTILAVIILLLVLTKLFYKPIKKMVEERRKFIQNNINESINKNRLAALDRDEANEELINAKLIAKNIISDAKLEAEKIKRDNLINIKEEAKEIISKAQKEILREKKSFIINSKKEMIDIALGAAKKIIEKNVDNKMNRKIVKDFILKETKENND